MSFASLPSAEQVLSATNAPQVLSDAFKNATEGWVQNNAPVTIDASSAQELLTQAVQALAQGIGTGVGIA